MNDVINGTVIKHDNSQWWH